MLKDSSKALHAVLQVFEESVKLLTSVVEIQKLKYSWLTMIRIGPFVKISSRKELAEILLQKL